MGHYHREFSGRGGRPSTKEQANGPGGKHPFRFRVSLFLGGLGCFRYDGIQGMEPRW